MDTVFFSDYLWNICVSIIQNNSRVHGTVPRSTHLLLIGMERCIVALFVGSIPARRCRPHFYFYRFIAYSPRCLLPAFY